MQANVETVQDHVRIRLNGRVDFSAHRTFRESYTPSQEAKDVKEVEIDNPGSRHSLAVGILTHDARRMIHGHSVLAVGEPRPRLAVVVGAEYRAVRESAVPISIADAPKAAEAAGFRACKRCRPDGAPAPAGGGIGLASAPRNPAWMSCLYIAKFWSDVSKLGNNTLWITFNGKRFDSSVVKQKPFSFEIGRRARGQIRSKYSRCSQSETYAR